MTESVRHDQHERGLRKDDPADGAVQEPVHSRSTQVTSFAFVAFFASASGGAGCAS